MTEKHSSNLSARTEDRKKCHLEIAHYYYQALCTTSRILVPALTQNYHSKKTGAYKHYDQFSCSDGHAAHNDESTSNPEISSASQVLTIPTQFMKYAYYIVVPVQPILEENRSSTIVHQQYSCSSIRQTATSSPNGRNTGGFLVAARRRGAVDW
jgi:hypothetical protein